MAKGGSFRLTEKFTRAFGKTGRLKDTESITTATGPSMWGPGRTTTKTDTEQRYGWMALSFRETTKWGRSMDMENSNGRTGLNILESSEKTTCTERECTSGAMGGSTMETECTTAWKAKGCFHGWMTESTQETTITTKKKALGSSNGPMGGYTMESGRMASSMGVESLLRLLESRGRDTGKMERESTGTRMKKIFNFIS